MASFADERLRRLHAAFLDAAGRFLGLCLRHAAANDRGVLPDWPQVPDGDHRHLGLPNHCWWPLLQRRERELFTPLPPQHWFRIDGRIWEGAFYNGGPSRTEPWGDAPSETWEDLQAQNEGYKLAIADFQRLADSAAGHFDMQPSPHYLTDFPLEAKGWHRWLELLYTMPFAETEFREEFLVRRLPGDVFTASARAIEVLSDAVQTSVQTIGKDNTEDSQRGKTGTSQDPMVEIIDRFLRVARRYWQHFQLERLTEGTVSISRDRDERTGCHTDCTDLVTDLLKHQRDQNSARKALAKIGRVLSVRLEESGEDSSTLLMFLHAVDGGGGPPAAAPLWPQLKVALQRTAIRSGLHLLQSDENVSERLPKDDADADLLKPAIANLLRVIPETWAEFNIDSLTAIQSDALFLLTAAGMVERRGRVRCEMLSHSTYIDETFQATGEGGFVEALRYSTAAMWGVWGDAYRAWRNEPHGNTPPFHAAALNPQEWRLTGEGVLARGDLDGTNPGGNPDVVFDFVLKRGFYGPGHWLRIMAVPELFRKHEREIRERTIAGQDLGSLSRPPVRGHGQLIAFHKIERSGGAQSLNSTNRREPANAFAAAFNNMLGPMFEAISKGQQVGWCGEAGVMDKCQILFLAASPAGTRSLALDDECREIEQKLRAADYRDALTFITKWAVRPDDLLQYLNQFRPHVVHFSGHGSSTEEIVLMDKDRQPKPVSKAALKQLFSTLRDNIRLVVLNACFSRPQAEAITEVIDCAIGMKRAIGDKAAITFAASFYRAIAFGRTVQEAFDQGKAALMLEGIPEQDTPVLLVRPGVNPNSIFLVKQPV